MGYKICVVLRIWLAHRSVYTMRWKPPNHHALMWKVFSRLLSGIIFRKVQLLKKFRYKSSLSSSHLVCCLLRTFDFIQGDISVQLKPPVDIVPTVPTADLPLLTTYCTGRMTVYPKSESTEGFNWPNRSPCTALKIFTLWFQGMDLSRIRMR